MGKEGRKEGRREEEFIAVEIPIVESLSSFLSKKERERGGDKQSTTRSSQTLTRR